MSLPASVVLICCLLLLFLCTTNLIAVVNELRIGNKLRALQLKQMGVAEEELEKIMNKK